MPGLCRLKSVRVKGVSCRQVSRTGCRLRHYRHILSPQQRQSGQIRDSRAGKVAGTDANVWSFPISKPAKESQP